ncbi:hypothetical protein C1I60_21530 [Paenibacillus terrae]|uniref:Uncharacterized protein n=1 Tax=Paenibacillus terrae TaxID=159743 RepID=A0A4U2PUK0_9BACL|nr:hypothetical protein C1I60_21530 [Paenibacillus terrae]
MILAVGASVLTGVISNSVHADNDAPIRNESVTYDPVPPEVLEELRIPDKISTKDGLFVKTLHAEENFSQDEVVYNGLKTTDKTKAIIQYDATYIKEEDNE